MPKRAAPIPHIMTSSAPIIENEPIATVQYKSCEITLLGTAHVSRASAEKVEKMIDSREFDSVAVELCPSRHNAIVNPDSLQKMDLFEVLKQKKMPMVAATLALGAYQQRLAEQFDIMPGQEMRSAIERAREHQLPVYLVDREIGTTLRRIYRNIPWWRRAGMIVGLLGSLFSREKVSEEDIERLKEGDMLETTFSQFADDARELYIPLIDERDQYMASRLIQEANNGKARKILAIVGAGHLSGIQRYLEADIEQPKARIEQLDTIPPASIWPKTIPWIIVALILTGFAIGFSQNSAVGWQLVLDWVLINGGLCALGALIAGAHPLTIVSAFAAAPITSLNPTIGAGFVTAAVELFLRKPSVGDFSQIRTDSASVKGWWRNRVTRTLLVFLLSTMGSAIGTYLAGFQIFNRLTGG